MWETLIYCNMFSNTNWYQFVNVFFRSIFLNWHAKPKPMLVIGKSNLNVLCPEPQMFSMSQSYTLPLLTNGHAKGVTSLYTVAGEHFPVWIYIVKTGKIWKMVKNRDRVKESNIWLRTGSKSFLLPFFTFQWSSSEFDLEIGRPARNRELGQLHAAKTAKFWIEWGARSKQ